jgi:hypothetical protein
MSVATTEFHETLGALGIAQQRVAKLFGVGPRSVRRWQNGDRRIPCGVDIIVRLLAAGTVTFAQLEQAAVRSAPEQTAAPNLNRPLPLRARRPRVRVSQQLM